MTSFVFRIEGMRVSSMMSRCDDIPGEISGHDDQLPISHCASNGSCPIGGNLALDFDTLLCIGSVPCQAIEFCL